MQICSSYNAIVKPLLHSMAEPGTDIEERPTKLRKLSFPGLDAESILKGRDDSSGKSDTSPTRQIGKSSRRGRNASRRATGPGFANGGSTASITSGAVPMAVPATQSIEAMGANISGSATADAIETNDAVPIDCNSSASESADEGGVPLPSSAPISKNQLKKLRKQEKWDAGRDFRKQKRKQKIQDKKARKKAAEADAAANENGKTEYSHCGRPLLIRNAMCRRTGTFRKASPTSTPATTHHTRPRLRV